MEFVNKYLIILAGLTLFSCSRNSSTEETSIDNATLLNIKTSNGENFLNTINTSNIELYYKKNGTLTLLNYTSPGAVLDYPKGYTIVQEAPINEKMIKIFCYIGENGETNGETYIKWNNNDMDTISYSINRSPTGNITIS